MFGNKCPYCRGKNLYVQKTWPTRVLGCRDCQAKTSELMKRGFSKSEAARFIKGNKP